MPFIGPRIIKRKKRVIVASRRRVECSSVIGSDFKEQKTQKKEKEEKEPLQCCKANNNPCVIRAVLHCICSLSIPIILKKNLITTSNL